MNKSSPSNLRETWTQVQRAETLLFHAAAAQKPERARQLFAGLELPSDGLNLLIRSGMGFDPECLRPEDYFGRYPFSDVDEIRTQFDGLAAESFALKQKDGSYALSEKSIDIYHTWMDRVAMMMDSIDLGPVSEEEVLTLLAYDRRIIEALQNATRPHRRHVFHHHLQSIRPDYHPPKRWHHWQYVATMLAASEDEEEYVRQQRGLSPLVWFTRRQIWFYHRRPWRYQVRTLSDLVRRANGYSPLKNAEQACAGAIQELETRGWLTTEEGEFRLTDSGLSTADADEKDVDAGFLSGWPDFRDDEITELNTITARLNNRYGELIQQAQPR